MTDGVLPPFCDPRESSHGLTPRQHERRKAVVRSPGSAPSPAAPTRSPRAALRPPAGAGRARSPQQLQAVAVGAPGARSAGRGHAPPGSREPREPPRARPQSPGRPAAAHAGNSEPQRAAGGAQHGGRHDTDATCPPTPPRLRRFTRPPLSGWQAARGRSSEGSQVSLWSSACGSPRSSALWVPEKPRLNPWDLASALLLPSRSF